MDRARLRADHSLGSTAADEVLRYDGPIRAQSRRAREALEIGGQHIEARRRRQVPEGAYCAASA